MKVKNKEIRVAIVGVGNCASSLIQGIEYYSHYDKKENDPSGLIFNDICGYDVSDIKIVAAFDVNNFKVGKKIFDAIIAEPNNTKTFFKNIRNDIIVSPGPILDGLSNRTKKIIKHHDIKRNISGWKNEIVSELKLKKVDILISYLPVGSKRASIFYADCAVKAKVAFANAIPEFICSSDKWAKKFYLAGLPCAGDDIKSQVGATIVHRVLVDLINKRGLKIDNTYQLNVGGNLDFLNMLDEDRLHSKRISKTEAVKKNVPEQDFETKIGPSDYIPFLKDNKLCFIEINGRQFGDVPFKLELKLSVEDSPNSAGVMVDVIRLLKVSIDRGLKGYQNFSSYYFKHPKTNIIDDAAYDLVKNFIANKSS